MFVDVDQYGEFRLDPDLVEAYRNRPVNWGFGALSWVTFQRTYSRDGEAWWQTCRRVIEGACTVQKIHCLERRLPWDERAAQQLAADAFDRLWRFKWTPPGRGLWIMGTRYMYERGGAALNNCGFISTKDIARDFTDPFVWMLEMLMLGVGVGFDTRGREQVTIRPPVRSDGPHVIGDSREGWAAALRRLLGAYVGEASLPAEWRYDRIRPKGAPLRSFGGMASGPEPLRKMIESIQRLYDSYVGTRVDSPLIVDTMNLIGRCVVAGGIRRSAQIAFGDPSDTAFLDLKVDPEQVADHRWASNNSIIAPVGMDYHSVAKRTAGNGEPGYLWLDNARAFGRMADPPDHRDAAAEGSNPCVEQTLWDRELCCLVETYPAHHDTLEDFKKTLRVAYWYAKVVTLVPTHDPTTNGVMAGNRRVGCSMTGVVQAANKHGMDRFLKWCDDAYHWVQHLDAQYAADLQVPRSIKTTSVKPSGTVSLLAGATPGVHWEHAPYYLRRIRVDEAHPLVEICQRAGYPLERDVYSDQTMVIGFPIHVPHVHRHKADVPVREKVDLAAAMQKWWSDNQVSCTAEFDPDTEAETLPELLAESEARLKGVVFLPAARHGYAQPPYERIDREAYERMVAKLRPLEGDLPHEPDLEARFCEGGMCAYP